MNDYIIEREFEHSGYKCVVVFRSIGHRCGYVGIHKGHPLYKKDYKSVGSCFQCHGGLTYSDGGKDSHYPIDSDLWWFGFDCAHYGDGKDLDLAYEKFPDLRGVIECMAGFQREFPGNREVVRTEEYVAAECRRLAEQLKDFRESPQNVRFK